MRKDDLLGDPIEQLQAWIQEAIKFGIEQPNAMSLATSSLTGYPSVRFVLLKEIRPEGLVFYTDARSRKIRDLSENPRAAAAIYWDSMHRQIRAAGLVQMLPFEEAQEYFHRRPQESQWVFHAAAQGEVVADRSYLEAALERAKTEHPEGAPAPHAWVGCLLVPERIEFWQEREGRLHDRIEYVRDPSGWQKQRLAP